MKKRRHTWYYLDESLGGRIVVVYIKSPVKVYVIELGKQI